MADVEDGTCDFCGTPDVPCAVSELGPEKPGVPATEPARICESCALWASNQFTKRKYPRKAARPIGRSR